MTADSHSEELKQAVERMRGGTATFIESVPVKETFEGKTAWEGAVHIFARPLTIDTALRDMNTSESLSPTMFSCEISCAKYFDI